MSKRIIVTIMALAVISLIVPTEAGELHNNGPLVTHPGDGFGGNDASRLMSVTLGENLHGYGHQVGNQNWVADDFTVAGLDWLVDDITFYAYQTGAPQGGTLTAYNVNIYDGAGPGQGNLVASSSTLNTTGFSGIYRDTETSVGDSGRAIQASVVDFGGVQLGAGTYWMDWQADGTLTSGPWAPPVSFVNITHPAGANGHQSVDDRLTWAPVEDSGSFTPDAFPFIINGSVVPEPGSALLLLLAAGSLLGFRRR